MTTGILQNELVLIQEESPGSKTKEIPLFCLVRISDPVFILAWILKYFLRIKFMKNWREIIVRSYQNKTSWEPVICKSNSLFGFLFTHRATASTGNVQYSDLFWNK